MRSVTLFLLTISLFIGSSSHAGVAVVHGQSAGLIYDSLIVNERHAANETYKSVGGISCSAQCSESSKCEHSCVLKYPSQGHAELWNALQLSVRERKGSGGLTEFYKEIGPLQCTARLRSGDSVFSCIFKPTT
jgi:hypothetical protein